MIHGFLLANGSFTTIGVPGANAALPSGIHAAGRIAEGYYVDANGTVEAHGFVAQLRRGNSRAPSPPRFSSSPWTPPVQACGAGRQREAIRPAISSYVSITRAAPRGGLCCCTGLCGCQRATPLMSRDRRRGRVSGTSRGRHGRGRYNRGQVETPPFSIPPPSTKFLSIFCSF